MLDRIEPVGLLLITGTLLGMSFPLGKLAAGAQVSPLLWSLVVSLGALALLGPVLAYSGQLRLPSGQSLRYVVVSGLVTFAGVNLLLFFLIDKVGAGYAGLMFALSPVFTMALSLVFGLGGPRGVKRAGVFVALIGAAVVALTRGGSGVSMDLWAVAALAIPLILALGNVYRTLDWPETMAADALAFWSHAVAVIALLAAMPLMGGGVDFARLADIPLVTLAQAVAAGMTFPFFFRLQRKGGPVMLSQIGYVAAGVGIGAATLFLGERFELMTWGGVAVVAVGLSLSLWPERKRPAKLLGQAGEAC